MLQELLDRGCRRRKRRVLYIASAARIVQAVRARGRLARPARR